MSSIAKLDRRVYSINKGEKFKAILYINNTPVEESIQITNNKISAASKLGVWIKNNQDTINNIISQQSINKNPYEGQDLIFKDSNSSAGILIHQLKKGYETTNRDGYKIIEINSNYNTSLGSIYIGGSFYPIEIDFDKKIIFIATHIQNANNGNYLYESHKNQIINFIFDNLGKIENKEFTNINFLNNKKKLRKPVLFNNMSMSILLGLDEK